MINWVECYKKARVGGLSAFPLWLKIIFAVTFLTSHLSLQTVWITLRALPISRNGFVGLNIRQRSYGIGRNNNERKRYQFYLTKGITNARILKMSIKNDNFQGYLTQT